MSREMTTHERQAVQRVERAIGRLPESVAIYFHGEDATVLACDDDGKIVRDGQEIDHDAILTTMRTPRCIAGGW
jgi:hypothetical protein